ncbi:site-specific integrase [Actibacterium lipolyticum]|uniref:site-specific integrase n=1 Tax=Actibacterium lipolyticum TaxID=1524263 RepID=UPI001F2D97DE|nr:site-specific integrase [Actibacterium lipolyticum]
MAGLRQSEIREKVTVYFKAQLDQYLDWLDRRGLSKNALADAREEMLDHDCGVDLESLSPAYLPIARFKRVMDVSDEQWEASQPRITIELRKGRRDMLRRVLDAAEGQESYSYGETPAAIVAPPAPTQDASSPLGVAVEEFNADQARRLPDKTAKQNRAYLGILLEYFGPERLLGSITKQDANKVKQVLHDLPSNRKVKTTLKGLPLMEAIKVPGQAKISDKTIDSHIQMFAAFFQWAETHGHAPHRLFEGMKLGKRAKKNEIKRKPFTPEQAQRILTELTENTSGLVRSESHKWGMLLALFTGARLNEICQLHIADVRQEDDIWFLDITDEGDDGKKLKTEAGRRKVPLHSELIRLGFLELVQSRSKGKRLFPDYNLNVNGGYGRSLGRWCNERFLPELGIKEPGIVFHCFRHTIVTRLSQVDVPEPIVQCIVGHARSGVTQDVYMREGYKLRQLKSAIDRFRVF